MRFGRTTYGQHVLGGVCAERGQAAVSASLSQPSRRPDLVVLISGSETRKQKVNRTVNRTNGENTFAPGLSEPKPSEAGARLECLDSGIAVVHAAFAALYTLRLH